MSREVAVNTVAHIVNVTNDVCLDQTFHHFVKLLQRTSFYSMSATSRLITVKCSGKIGKKSENKNPVFKSSQSESKLRRKRKTVCRLTHSLIPILRRGQNEAADHHTNYWFMRTRFRLCIQTIVIIILLHSDEENR